ncbi:VanW family protein [Effusibacillus lacus]|uniref:Vancomycin resistance protein n=1 Tax=Effusibacillus lacus TaxID=1348429 RepID=A0A292YFG2_9BACL|nr:VanW family protein [Effusibacillus lacus]TCS74297.1 vancomycin resistance protein VanW [Effusibacillus lacus]GAX88757.1 vancomycin resistance protein [Effusibacillus lacus]
MNEFSLRPRRRSWLRMKLGRLYFSLKRYIQWHLSGTGFAQEKWDGRVGDAPFLYVVFEHRSLLYRQLRNVDMWLQKNKVHNLQLAVPKLNGLILRPGETMSYWKLIGPPTKRNGYLKGMVLHEGTFQPDYGGGLCQLSNLIYWATLHTPLTVTERYRHQYDVFPDADRTQPFGSGATCAYNYVDLQIRNDTDVTFCLQLDLTDTHLVGVWLADQPIAKTYEVYEKHHRFTQELWGGHVRHNQIWRRVFENGEQVDDELVTENHALMMYSPLLAEGEKT